MLQLPEKLYDPILFFSFFLVSNTKFHHQIQKSDRYVMEGFTWKMNYKWNFRNIEASWIKDSLKS